MALFTPKSHQQITASMAAKIAAETPITDFSSGSVVLTLLEAAAQEDFQQYIQMLNIIRNYNLDTTEGEDLDKRAAEYGLTRKAASAHSGFITITDTRFTKISSKIYAGFPGPLAGSSTIYVDNASAFPTSGDLYIGRGTNNSEGPISYSAAPVDNTSYWAITLDSPLINDHGTDETVILSQYGTRVVESGTEVEIPENDVSDKVSFELTDSVEIQDGETEVTNVLVVCLESGGFTVPSNSIKSFSSEPFPDAAVTNPLPFVNGRDIESDQELRDRIRDTIQSLSRGTKQSISTGIIGLIDSETNSSVVSASVVPPTILADGPTQVFIDNGRGLEPSLAAIGLEILTEQATGGEKFFQLENFPVTKASLISQNYEPFLLAGGETLLVKVGTDEETITFASTDFVTTNAATANEIATAINNRSTLVEARTSTENNKVNVFLTPVARTNETLQVDESSTANSALNFSTISVDTLRLYKNNKLLTKDGLTASVLSLPQPFGLEGSLYTTSDGDITVTPNSAVVSKSATGSPDDFIKRFRKGDYLKFFSDSDTFYKKIKAVVTDDKIILEEPYSSTGGGFGNITVWRSQQLEVAANGDYIETEVASFGPNDFATPAQALAQDVLTRLNTEINLSKVELSLNNTRIKILSDLENSEESKMQITGGGAALALGFCSSSNLPGTSLFSSGSKLVVGTSTSYTTTLKAGDWIRASSDDPSDWTKIEAIENDTTLWLELPYRGSAVGVSTLASKIDFSTLATGANKDYTLNRSNGQIELETPLVAGDQVTAGSITTRAYVDSAQETFNFNTVSSPSELIVALDGGLSGTVSSGGGMSNFAATALAGYSTNFFNGFYIEWVSGNNTGQTSRVGSYNSVTGDFTTITPFTNVTAVGEKFILCQVIEFTHATDFANPLLATASEVATVLNRELFGTTAEVLSSGAVRLRTNTFDSYGKIQIKGGTANQVLLFSEEEASNELADVAYIVNSNSERQYGNANAKGFTLGANQNLVIILDDDSANKTFVIPMYISGTTTASAIGSFSMPSLATKYSSGYFDNFWVYWTSGPIAGYVQTVTSYGPGGTFTVADAFPTVIGLDPGVGSTFELVPRTAENVVAHLNDLNISSLSVSADVETIGVSGDYIQISTKETGSAGKAHVTGGTANSITIPVQNIPSGAPVNDLEVNSKAGLSEGLLTVLGFYSEVTIGDNTPAYDTFTSSNLITGSPGYFTGMAIQFTTGLNVGKLTFITSYNNVTGEITVSPSLDYPISAGDTFGLGTGVFIESISGTSAPFTLTFVDYTGSAVDVSNFTSARGSAVTSDNPLGFSTAQKEGVDGYKYFTGLIQKTQWTIDGLDSDPDTYPGIGAAGTQFEVVTPKIVRIRLEIDITTDEGVSLSSVSNSVANAVLEYINSLGVGKDVILSEVIAAAQSVSGVFDIDIINHSSNITIADGELANLAEKDLIIG